MRESRSSSGTTLNRRSLLKSVAPAASVFLAGCESPCFGTHIKHSLSLAVKRFQRTADGFELGLTLQNVEKEYDGRNAEFTDITVHLFSFALDEITTRSAGRLSYGEERTETVVVDTLPAFITVVVGSARVQSDVPCEEIQMQEQIIGYAGNRISHNGGPNHQWTGLGYRRSGDEFPLDERWRKRLKCVHRKAQWDKQSPRPDLTLLERDPVWLDTAIDSPQITRVYQSIVGVVTEEDDRRFKRTVNTSQIQSLSKELQAFVTDGSSGYIPRKRYFELVSAFEGRSIRTLPELPDYSKEYVEGHASRHVAPETCGFVGRYNKYLWYYVEGETDVYYVVLNYRENRNHDRRWMQFEPKCEDWGGIHEVLFYRPDTIGVWTANQAVRVTETPPAVLELLATVEDQRGYYLNREQWFDIREQLGVGRTVPSCDSPHVGCESFANCAGGKGQELWAYYLLMGESPEWMMALRYRERGEGTDTPSGTPKNTATTSKSLKR